MLTFPLHVFEKTKSLCNIMTQLYAWKLTIKNTPVEQNSWQMAISGTVKMRSVDIVNNCVVVCGSHTAAGKKGKFNLGDKIKCK